MSQLLKNRQSKAVVTATDLRKSLSEIIKDTYKSDQSVVVTVSDQPKIVVVDYSLFEELKYKASLK